MKLYRYYTKTRRVITCGATVVVADDGLWRLIGRPRPGAHDARRTRTHLAIGGPRLMRFGRVFESERSWWPVFTAVWQTAASTRARQRLNDCSMKHYIVLNMALFSHAHVTISAEIKLTHACSRGNVSHERTAAA